MASTGRSAGAPGWSAVSSSTPLGEPKVSVSPKGATEAEAATSGSPVTQRPTGQAPSTSFLSGLAGSVNRKVAEKVLVEARVLLESPMGSFALLPGTDPDRPYRAMRAKVLKLLEKASRCETTRVQALVTMGDVIAFYGREGLCCYLELNRCGHSEPSEALKHYDTALQIDPSHRIARCRKAACLTALGRYSEAGDILDSLIREMPRNHEVLLRKALVAGGYSQCLAQATELGADIMNVQGGLILQSVRW